MPEILNSSIHGIPRGSVYVGRPSDFGNPFAVGVYGWRGECIAAFERWINMPEQTALRERAKRELRGKDLVCSCAPQPCHAEVLMKIANEDD